MHIVLLTNEYPPYTYGGAGNHIEHLSQSLASLEDGQHTVEVLSFGDQVVDEGRLRVRGITPDFRIPTQRPEHAKLMDTLARDLLMAGRVERADIVHGHTWYSHLACCLVQQLHGARMVLTTHSLEPHRPWKVEQLGTAYYASTWIERTAYENADGVVAVSEGMAQDVRELYGVPSERIEVIPNGIDPNVFKTTYDKDTLRRLGVDPAVPYVLFVGRVTRQKGIVHLVHALQHLPEGTQVVLAAGQPDTPEIGREMEEAVAEERATGNHRLVWIDRMLPRRDLMVLYSHAAVFVCPSVYEPFGIINLEAMACETAVVASAVGGVPEVVVDGETGVLVPLDQDDAFEPRDAAAFARTLAAAVTDLLRDPQRAAAMGRAGRRRVEEKFSWDAVARQTLAFYRRLIAAPPGTSAERART